MGKYMSALILATFIIIAIVYLAGFFLTLKWHALAFSIMAAIFAAIWYNNDTKILWKTKH